MVSNTNQVDTTLLKGLVEKQYENNPGIRGIIVHVENTKLDLSWTEAMGAADTNGRKLNVNDAFLIASTTKTYVAASIMRLIEEGHFNLDSPIAILLSNQTDSLMKTDGYNTNKIKVKHLLSNTSGISDYVETETYMKRTIEEPQYEWSKWEQMQLTIRDNDPIAAPGETFSYSDMNFLLLTEIIEETTDLPFYTAIRQLLKYNEMELRHTWFNTLESAPINPQPLIHQFAKELGVDSYSLHASFDLYGGGGIASTAQDMARFFHLLFEGKIFNKPSTLDLMHTLIRTNDSIPNSYYMGFDQRKTGEFSTKGHGGFWGTNARYCEELNTTVAVIVLERSYWNICFDLSADILSLIKESEE